MLVEDRMRSSMIAYTRWSGMSAASQSAGLVLFAAVGGVPRVKSVGSILMWLPIASYMSPWVLITAHHQKKLGVWHVLIHLEEVVRDTMEQLLHRVHDVRVASWGRWDV
jgi:hypothetical protein